MPLSLGSRELLLAGLMDIVLETSFHLVVRSEANLLIPFQEHKGKKEARIYTAVLICFNPCNPAPCCYPQGSEDIKVLPILCSKCIFLALVFLLPSFSRCLLLLFYLSSARSLFINHWSSFLCL